jgi:hypothetical protein
MRPYLNKSHHKKRADGVVQGEGPEFKPHHHKKKISGLTSISYYKLLINIILMVL